MTIWFKFEMRNRIGGESCLASPRLREEMEMDPSIRRGIPTKTRGDHQVKCGGSQNLELLDLERIRSPWGCGSENLSYLVLQNLGVWMAAISLEIRVWERWRNEDVWEVSEERGGLSSEPEFPQQDLH